MSDYDDHSDHDCQIEVESAMESYADHLADRAPAPELSAEERAVVEQFENAPDGLLEPGEYACCFHCTHLRLTDQHRVPCDDCQTIDDCGVPW